MKELPALPALPNPALEEWGGRYLWESATSFFFPNFLKKALLLVSNVFPEHIVGYCPPSQYIWLQYNLKEN